MILLYNSKLNKFGFVSPNEEDYNYGGIYSSFVHFVSFINGELDCEFFECDGELMGFNHELYNQHTN